MAATPEIFGAVVVVLGSFNPPIFSPDWLAQNNLIGLEDRDSAKSSERFLMAKPITQLDTSWFNLQVDENRLSLTSKEALSPAVKDLAVGMLSLLQHTPVTAVGLNFVAHYRVDKMDDYHNVGDILAPKTIWHGLYPNDKHSVGMLDVTVIVHPSKRGDKPKTNDRKQITVQPSSRIKQGVYFAFNDHHEIVMPPDRKVTQAEIAVEIITKHWQDAWDESIRVFDHVLKTTIGERG